MTMISKVIASSTGKQSLKDVAGYESILARDEVSGQLFVPERENIEKSIQDITRLAQNQLFGALSSNYPVVNSDIKTYPEKSKHFVQSFPSHILVDFKAFAGECHNVPDGYLGFTGYMYLRNTKKRLTEAYAIEVGANNEIAVDGISSALFKNIPANEIENSRIYLVAVITETIQVGAIDQKNGANLTTIRKGMCAGVVDVSRIFTRRKDHLHPGESYEFSMKLYASYMTEETQAAPFKLYPGISPLLAMSMTMENNGWGELVDRIISGSNKGIAINPRLDTMAFKIKELRNDSFLSDSQSDPAVAVIRTLFYDPMEANYDRIYLKVNKITDIVSSVKLPTLSSIFKKKMPDFVTVSVRSSSKEFKFSNGSNEETQNSWDFVSTSIGENVGEVIQISGLPVVPTKDNDYLYFDVFINGVFHASGKYTLRTNNEILSSELTSKRSKRVELVSPNSTAPVGAIEITLEYVGKHYNSDPCIDKLLNWETIYDKSLLSTGNELISTLTQVRKTGIQTVVKFFPQLMSNLLQIYRFASEKNQILSVYGASKDTKFKHLADTCFVSIVHILDMAIARQDDYIYLFDALVDTFLPKVGNFLMKDMIAVLGDFENTWNSTCRAICRVCPLISTLAINSIDDVNKLSFLTSWLCLTIWT
ncbi:unnamed protein product [Ambrosiozyma monospora]|uniref:Unnamed protein product n=1 Tax=Ambrosiozyma monospora TaxID=43982 RepID=A0ACB5TP18_AMBMO|nr:unnamed protein product [Ambrosiozyma monospora]